MTPMVVAAYQSLHDSWTCQRDLSSWLGVDSIISIAEWLVHDKKIVHSHKKHSRILLSLSWIISMKSDKWISDVFSGLLLNTLIYCEEIYSPPFESLGWSIVLYRSFSHFIEWELHLHFGLLPNRRNLFLFLVLSQLNA
jgi:hypothetical protein